MSNYHFKDKRLSLKAKGLLSLMLSLPEEWDYSVVGLASLSSDGETSVRTAIKELEENHYLDRTPVRENGRIIDWEYDIYEQPKEILEVENQQVENLTIENVDNKVYKQLSKKEESRNNSKELLQNSDFQFGKSKPKNESLYTKCVSLIKQRTNDEQIRSLLIDWLNMLLEKYKDKGKVLYVNVFKGKLNMLDKYNADDWKEIIEYNLQRGYEGFYPVEFSSYSRKDKPWEEGVRSSRYTDQELEELEILNKEREAKGMRTQF